MAETLLNILAEELVGRALSLAADRLSRLWGVKEDLETLAEKVEMAQSLLSDAEGKCTTNTVQVWLAKLHTVSFDAGNLLDEFTYEVQRNAGQAANELLSRNIAYSSMLLEVLEVDKSICDIGT